MLMKFFLSKIVLVLSLILLGCNTTKYYGFSYTGTGNSTFQFIAIIDGKPVSATQGFDAIVNGSHTIRDIKKPPDSSFAIYQSFFYKYPSGNPVIQINAGTLKYLGSKPPKNEFENFIKSLKNTPYSPFASNGIEVIYRDNSNIRWSSSNGKQINSSFSLSQIEITDDEIRFTANFNCSLYNSDNKVVILEKGIFTGSFKNN